VKRIYVGNLSWNTSEDELRDFFAPFGSVTSVSIITDRDTGRSRGFAFVEMDDADAVRAIQEANGKELGGRSLRIDEAQERQRGGGGGGGGGGRDRY
jgi:RNA recognition motif-containing protein